MSSLVEYIRIFGRFQRNARLYLISNALSGVTVGIILVLYNLYLVSLGYGADFIGLVLFAGTIGAGMAIFPAGMCFDRFGGKAILIWSSVAIGVAGVGQILFRQPFPLLVSGFLVGLAGAFILVVNAPFLTRNSLSSERAHLFSFNIVLSLVAVVIGEVFAGALPLWFRTISWLMAPLPPWLNWLLANQPLSRSYQLALLFAGLISGPSFIPLLLLSDDRSVVSLVNATLSQERTPFVQRVHWLLTRWRQPSSLRTVLVSPILVLMAVQALVGMGAGLFIPYFNIYFVQHLRVSSALFGAIDGGANATNALFTLAAPWLAIRIGKIKTITLTRLISIPLLLSIGMASLLPLPVVAVLYLFRQGTMDMGAGILQVFSMEVVPERHRGLVNSSYQATYQVSWALTVPLGGLIIAHLGYPPVFILAAILYLLAIAALWWRFRGDDRSTAAVCVLLPVEEVAAQPPPQATTHTQQDITS